MDGINEVEAFLLRKTISPTFWVLVIMAVSCLFLSDKWTIILALGLAIFADGKWVDRWMAYANPKIEHWFKTN